MNKIYKVVWSRVKHCYVVASELAKSHSKVAASRVIGRTVLVGVLVCVVSCGAVMPKMAEAKTLISENTQEHSYVGNSGGPLNYIIPGININGKVDVIKLTNSFHLFDPVYPSGNRGYTNEIYVHTDISGNVRYFASAVNDSWSGGDNLLEYYRTYELSESEVNAALGSGANVSALVGGGGTSYTAGNGITINGETISAKAGDGITVGSGGIAAKAGTNVTVNSNGISVTGNGSVASGNTGLIDGGKLYSEVRPSDNGNYVIQLELYNFISSFPLFSSFLTIP